MNDYKVWFPDDGDTAADAINIYAFNAECAANAAAEQNYHDSGGWDGVDCQTVCVQGIGEKLYRFYVTALHDPTFEAEAIDDEVQP